MAKRKKADAEGQNEQDDSLALEREASLPFHVVGLGASAGGLEALREFFVRMPPDSGMAFVVVMHLDPGHESILDQLLQKYTAMPVNRIQDGMKLMPDQVYVIPPNRELGLFHGSLQLLKKPSRSEGQMAIDAFFRSLAEDQGAKTVCVILSGTGTDGSLGLREVKEKGGLVVIQSPETAAQKGMPNSAIETGLADYILAPAAMPETLLNYIQESRQAEDKIRFDRVTQEALPKIFSLLRTETAQDFGPYRLNTLFRRITKRMAIHKIDNVDNYVYFLRQNRAEVTSLFFELLIGVTQFFREPEAFERFKEKALPPLFRDRTEEEGLRLWVPGCSTGEEAFTLAMLLYEYKQAHLPNLKVDIFATDVNPLAIQKARSGEYPSSIAADVPESYLQSYFIKYDHTYQLRREIREMVTFAEQSLLKDPPFSRLEVISCRNLLIYLKPEAQQRVLSLFQYALKPGGFLLLGSSENTGDFTKFFSPIDRKWRLFRRTETRAITPLDTDFSNMTLPPALPESRPREVARGRLPNDQRQLVEKLLLEHHNTVGILINDTGEILYSYGPVDLYLKMVPGEARFNLVDMARSGLQAELMTAIRPAMSQTEPVRVSGIQVKINGGQKQVDLIIKPVSTSAPSNLFLIILEEPAVGPGGLADPSARETITLEAGTPQLQALREELAMTKQHLQNMIEELQAANEEHRSYAEELQSANEELQSTNEELTTSQEELQSVNEELVTANSEIQNKNVELRQANDDLHNLLAGTNIATIFLDTRLNIKRFTPTATQIVNLIATDVGRPLRHTVSNLVYDQLIEDVEQVLDTLNTQEREVQTQEGRWYTLRILPYRTLENVIDGAVLTFAEITSQKKVEAQLRQLNKELEGARDYSRETINTLHEGLLILAPDLRILSANRSFYEKFKVTRAETEGKRLHELGNGQWDIPELRQLLETIIAQNSVFEGFEISHNFPKIGQRKMRLNARRLAQVDSQGDQILLAIEDITNHAG